MYRKILVAVDGSATSLRGLDEAIKVDQIANGRIRVVHVVDDLKKVPGIDAAAIDERKDRIVFSGQ